MTRRIALFLVALVVAACAPAQRQPALAPTVSPTPEVIQAPWWRETVFYEIFVRSFYDSNGDGTGDFNGITEKLDYLNDGNPATTTDLGVTGIWLMPVDPSPSYHGYDVTNYYAVNPQYGSMADFKRLLSEAHKRGIHVIIDLVLNHTSSQHPFSRMHCAARIRSITTGMSGRARAAGAPGTPSPAIRRAIIMDCSAIACPT